VAITNNSGATVTLNSLVVNWIDDPASQRINEVLLNGAQLWSGNSNNTPSNFTFTGTLADRQIASSGTKTLTLNFDETLAAGAYSLTATFDGCTVSQSAIHP